jgi:hypothetical protein
MAVGVSVGVGIADLGVPGVKDADSVGPGDTDGASAVGVGSTDGVGDATGVSVGAAAGDPQVPSRAWASGVPGSSTPICSQAR